MTVAATVHRRPVLVGLARAREAFGEAAAAPTPGARFLAAHLAALRVAAVVLAARGRPHGPLRASRPRNPWRLLAEVAPELAEWASYYAAGEVKRDAARSGLASLVTEAEADDLLRDTGAFLDLVEQALAPPGPQAGGRR